jgi:hypothetical protein
MKATCDISLKTWLTSEEAEIYTGYCRDILRKAREDGNLTFYRKKNAGRTSIRYRRDDLDKFMHREHDKCKARDEMPFGHRIKNQSKNSITHIDKGNISIM